MLAKEKKKQQKNKGMRERGKGREEKKGKKYCLFYKNDQLPIIPGYWGSLGVPQSSYAMI